MKIITNFACYVFTYMYYIFVVNNREDKKFILDAVKQQIPTVKIDYEIYCTQGTGDATRFTRIYCEFHQEDNVCFVACGGSGTANEVASGLIGYRNKSMAVLAYGITNDFTKNFPGRDFKSLKDIVEGEDKTIDVIKCNDDYCINVINIGFDARVAHELNEIYSAGGKYAYFRSISLCMLFYRYNALKIYVDGEKISSFRTLLCSVGNGRVCGGGFLISPYAIVDDGKMDVNVIKSCSLVETLMLLPKVQKGVHLDDAFCHNYVRYRRARHMEVYSKDLAYVCLDGEMIASTKFIIDLLPGALTVRLPKLQAGEGLEK